MPILPRRKSSNKQAIVQQPQRQPPLKLSFKINSPPMVMYGKRTESTGSLLNGDFILEVLQDAPFPLKKVSIYLIQEVVTKKQNAGSCPKCLVHTDRLASWEVLTAPTSLAKGSNSYPFAYLVPGEVPATNSSTVFSVSYRIEAIAIPDVSKFGPDQAPEDAHNFVYTEDISIKRSILPGPEKTSIRVFPPTEITAKLTLPSVVYPGSTLPLEMLIEGISICKNATEHKSTRWRLRKLNWRIEQTSKIRVFRCPQHQNVPLDKYISSKPEKYHNHHHHHRLGTHRSPLSSLPGGLFQSAAAALSGSIISNHTSSSIANPAQRAQRSAPQSPRNAPSNGQRSVPPSPLTGPSNSTRSVPPSPLATPSNANRSVPPSPLTGPSNITTNSIPSSPLDGPISTTSSILDSPLSGPVPDDPPPPAEPEFFYEDIIRLCEGEVKNGWKTDFSNEGQIQLDFQVSVPLIRTSFGLEDPVYGLQTAHTLIVEIMVAEETVASRTGQALPTGAARVLKMQFKLVMTDRSGLGISWEEEVPPTYEDVPSSPPTYEHSANNVPTINALSLTSMSPERSNNTSTMSPGTSRSHAMSNNNSQGSSSSSSSNSALGL